MKQLFIMSVLVLVVACAKPTVEESLANARQFEANKDYPAAVIEYKNVLMQQPRNSALRIELAEVYLKLGAFDEAEKELEKSVERGAEFNDIVGPLIKSMYYQDDYYRLLSRLGRFNEEELALDSQSALFKYIASVKTSLDERDKIAIPVDYLEPEHLLIAQAFEALSNGKPEAVITLSERFSSPQTEPFEKLMIKASAYAMLGDNQNAIQSYESALQIYSNYYPLRFLLAERLIAVGEMEKAEEQIAVLININPASGYANYLKAITLLYDEEYEEALQAANLAVQNGVNVPEARFIAGVSAFRTDRMEAAFTNLTSAAAGLPKQHIVHTLLLQVKLNLGYLADIGDSLDNALLDSEVSSELYALAALQNYRIDNDDKAEAYIENALSIGPQNSVSLLRKGLLQLERGDTSATATLARAVELDDKLAEGWALRAQAELETNGIEAAVKVAKEWQQTDLKSGLQLEALMYLNAGFEDTARVVFEKLYEVAPDNINATRFLMTSYARIDKSEEALALAKSMVDADPNNLFLLIDIVNLIWATNGDPNPFVEQRIQANPEAAAPVAAKAFVLIRDKKPEEAINLLKRSSTAPHYSTFMAMGEALLDESRVDEAIANYVDWTGAFPSDIRAWTRLILLNQKLGNYSDALTAASEASVYFPGNKDFLILQASLLVNLGEDNRAERILRSLEKDKNRLRDYNQVKGVLALNSNDAKKAVEHLAANYEDRPNFYSGKLFALALGRNGKYEEGLAVMKKEMQKAENDYIERHNIAEYAASHNDLKETLAQYQAILAKYPDDFATINNYANLMVQMDEIDDAGAFAQKALELRPQSPYSLSTMGLVTLKQGGDPVIAKNYIEQALSRAPDNTQIQLNMAEALVANNERIEAQTLLGRITPKSKHEREVYNRLKDSLR